MNDNTRQPRQNSVSQEHLYLPMANIKKMMKCSLPPNARISEDAKVTMQALVSEYMIFITREAYKRCLQHLRKTITVEDIMFAMCKFGFDQHATILNTLKSRLHCQHESKRVTVPREPSMGHTVEFEKMALAPPPVFSTIYPHQPNAGVNNPPLSHQSDVDVLSPRPVLPTLYPHRPNVGAYNPPPVFPTMYPHQSNVGAYNPTPIIPSEPNVGSYNPPSIFSTTYHHESGEGSYNPFLDSSIVYQPDVGAYNPPPAAFPTVYHHQPDMGAYNPTTMINFDGDYPSTCL